MKLTRVYFDDGEVKRESIQVDSTLGIEIETDQGAVFAIGWTDGGNHILVNPERGKIVIEPEASNQWICDDCRYPWTWVDPDCPLTLPRMYNVVLAAWRKENECIVSRSERISDGDGGYIWISSRHGVLESLGWRVYAWTNWPEAPEVEDSEND